MADHHGVSRANSRFVDESRLGSHSPGGAAHRIYEHLISLWAPGIIEAAYDLGLLPALGAGPATSAALAGRLGVDERVTRVLCDALAVYGIISRHGARFEIDPEVAGLFTEGGLYSLAGKIHYDRTVAWDAWRDFARTVRRGTTDADGTERANQISDVDYERLVTGINFWAPPIVELLAARLREYGWDTGQRVVVDVGCGTGIYSQLLLRAFPGARAHGMDVKRIIPIAQAQAERLGVAGRFQVLACDFRIDPWPVPADLALFVNIFHLQSPEMSRELVTRAAAALGDGGILCVVDHIVDRDGPMDSPQDRFALLFAASMAATGGGDAHSLTDYETWIAAAGLRRLALLDSPMHRILLAQKTTAKEGSDEA